MANITTTNSLSRNSIRTRILPLPTVIRDQIADERNTLDVVIDGDPAVHTLTISAERTYVARVTELFERGGVLRRSERGPEGRPSDVAWSFDPQTRTATIRFSPVGEWESVGRTEAAPSARDGVPSLKYFYEPLLRVLATATEPVSRRQLADLAADQLRLDEAARLETIPSGKVARYLHRSGWAGFALLRAGLIESKGRGLRAISKAGLDFVRTHPDPLDEEQLGALCQRVAQVDDEDADDADADDAVDVDAAETNVAEWLNDVVLASYADAEVARRLLSTFEPMIRLAHACKPSSWALTRRGERLRLLVSECVAFEIGKGVVGIGLHLDSIPEDQQDLFRSDTEKSDFDFRRIPSGVLRHLSRERFEATSAILEPASRRFIELAASRSSPFARFHNPEALQEIESILGVDLPRPLYRNALQPAAASDLITAGLAEAPTDRLTIRETAITEAHALIQSKLGALTEPDTRALLRLFNTDLSNGRPVYNRFTPAFVGHLANQLVGELGELNRWVESLWNATDDASVVRVLDELWSSDALPGAGSSFPTMVLHVRDPERFAPLMPGLAAGYQRLTGLRATRRSGQVYLDYARRIVELRREHGISPHAIDVVLLEAGSIDAAPLESTSAEPEPPPPSAVYDRAELLDETGLPAAMLAEIESLLRDKSQLVLCGPPGTGKTFLAERLARYLVQGGGEWRLVQFHPSYGYEDFIEGIRPRASSGGVTYDVEPGVFRTICEQAAALPDAKFVLVIDEINRGNLPRIFGELLYLLERRGPRYRVELAASRQKFSVPENLIVIGTMNTADQSIALVDVALRRRFYFVTLEPDSEVLRQWLTRHAKPMVHVAKVFARLNRALADEGLDENLCIGHSHFMVRGLDELMLRRIWDRGIRPTLADYFYGKPKILAKFDYERFVEAHREQDEADGEPSGV